MSKTDAELMLAQNITEEERKHDSDLEIFEVVLKYYGDISYLESNEYGNIKLVILLAGYAVAYVNMDELKILENAKEVIYIEKPRRLFFSVMYGSQVSCITGFQKNDTGIYGEGVICALIDSGIDYSHPVFLDQNGKTRIIALWDQTIDGNPPQGYIVGSVYSENDINRAIEAGKREQFDIVPSRDISGHGTHVAGIMAGNFADDKINNRGIATQSKIIAVKIGGYGEDIYPQTSGLMQAVDFVIKEAIKYNMPVAVNISLGNNYGSHDGTGLVETYIDAVSQIWRCSVCVGTGNQGDTAIHASGYVRNAMENVEISVGEMQRAFGIQLWKQYQDKMDISITTPQQNVFNISDTGENIRNFIDSNNRIYVIVRNPVPYSMFQEIYIRLVPTESYVDDGRWSININPIRIKDGRYDLWMSSADILSSDTFFLKPDPSVTLTIPSTSYGVISVGGYDSRTFGVADFSGRGYLRNLNFVKPDIVAPAVDIVSAQSGGGTSVRSGTSMAVPFVTGSAALLMEWGIVKGNDLYMYGERLKAVLISGAEDIKGQDRRRQGWGRLCVGNWQNV